MAVFFIVLGVEMIEEIDADVGLVLVQRIDLTADQDLDLHQKSIIFWTTLL